MKDNNKFPLSKRIHYWFEQFMSKGGSSIFLSLLIVFLISFTLIISIRAIIVYLGIGAADAGGYNNVHNFWDHIYFTFLQMTDPGNMYQDHESSPWIKISTIIAGFVGVIILSMLIAFITTALEKLMYNFRKGRGPVLENDFTLILGWNDRVVDIINELIFANEAEGEGVVVIMDDMPKEEIDDIISKHIPAQKHVKIVSTSGNTCNLHELKRINAHLAKSVIVMAKCEDLASNEEKLNSDINVVKTVMALNAFMENDIRIPVITEIFNDEKRKIINFINSKNVIALDNWDIMGKLLVQTSLTSGLVTVYNEILSFDMSELYYHENSKMEGVPFDDLIYHFEDGIPLGVYNETDGIMLRPEGGYTMKADDQIFILAEDESTIRYSSEKLFTSREDIPFEYVQQEKFNKRVLILGWHPIGRVFISESDDYLAQGSAYSIMSDTPSQEFIDTIRTIDEEFTNIKVDVIDGNPLNYETLKNIDPFSFDTILILSPRQNISNNEDIDSDTLIVSLMLKKIAKETQKGENTKVLSQMLNSENQDLILQTNVDDFIISNKMITMILAQLSEEPMMKLFYDDIFQEDGSEIYIKPAYLYFKELPAKLPFIDIIGNARKRDEICLGVRIGDQKNNRNNNFGVKLNPAKDEIFELSQNDFLVVLAEDEL